MILIAILFPWLILLLEDNPGGALVALIMQASIIGWLPATFWALRTLGESHNAKKARKKKKSAEEETE